ncbi:MAG: hypothetical protein JWM46_111 [Candidatus Kaiserbacteria bacterium]|nr:hypothetical protein [Candidatus Kaiserbacteria bacterium]
MSETDQIQDTSPDQATRDQGKRCRDHFPNGLPSNGDLGPKREESRPFGFPQNGG